MNKHVIKEIISWIMVFVFAIALAVIINKFVFFKVEIPSGSMEKTIMVGDKVITSKLSYVFGKPKRGDIVVFKYPDDESQDFIKRIIGLPGETIEGKDGYVCINGKPLNEDSYVMAKLASDFGPYTIPKDCYFMMGDNRSVSADARFWNNKFVHRDKILGKAILKYPHFKFLN